MPVANDQTSRCQASWSGSWLAGGEWFATFQHMIQRLGMLHLRFSNFIIIMHLSANGAAERMVRSVKRMAAELVNNHAQHWERMLHDARQAYVNMGARSYRICCALCAD